MSKFKITRTESGDDRITATGKGTLDEDELRRSVKQHISDVQNLFYYFMRKEVYPDVKSHDFTKLEDFRGFVDNINVKTDHNRPFKSHPWWKNHIRKEPHHVLLYNGEQKIHLGHFIHALCDWIAAGKARSKDGKFDVSLQAANADNKEEVQRKLYEAFLNTLEWLDTNSASAPGLAKGDSDA